jgi:hypothetical protein
VAALPGEIAVGLIDALAGPGLAFMSFMAAIPGLLPAVILTVVLLAPLFTPPLVVAVVGGVAYGLVLLVSMDAEWGWPSAFALVAG